MRWLRQKYILLYYNLRRFKIEEYSDDGKIVEESVTKYVPFNTQIREEIVFKLALTDLNLADARFSFGTIGEFIKRVFNIAEVGKRPYEFENRVHLALTFEMDLDL